MKKYLTTGDLIYAIGARGGEIKSRIKIVRTTKTLAISANNVRFRREYSGRFVHRIGERAFSLTSYSVETDELKTQYRKQQIQRVIGDNLEKFTLGQLEAMYKIAKGETKTYVKQ